jgi:hypothetical protein
MCRIFLVALRSKDCLCPCRFSYLEVCTLLRGLLLLRRKVPAMVTIICHDHPILIAARDLPPRRSGGKLEWCGNSLGSADIAWIWPTRHLWLHLVHRWYFQIISTFLNPFAVVSPLICVFWIQITWTNAVFSRIALVSRFCVEMQLLGKISENIANLLFYQKTR